MSTTDDLLCEGADNQIIRVISSISGIDMQLSVDQRTDAIGTAAVIAGQTSILAWKTKAI